ncbi:MAG: hypothetical protein AAFZ07_23345 [Actinomycetota bacterium]
MDIDYTADEEGYWVTYADGTVEAYGTDHYGQRPALQASEMVTSLSVTPGGDGYWLFTDRGRVHVFGDALSWGDLSTTLDPSGVPISDLLNGPIVGSVPTPTGNGYWMVASDGGIFAFGDAEFYGSMGGEVLNGPVVGLAPTPSNRGYWLVATDGGIFAFGDAGFYGSMGGEVLNQPVTSMIPQGAGYMMLATDGGIFNFGDSQFHGSLGGTTQPHPVVAATVRSDLSGYLLLNSTGTAFAFGPGAEVLGACPDGSGPPTRSCVPGLTLALRPAAGGLSYALEAWWDEERLWNHITGDNLSSGPIDAVLRGLLAASPTEAHLLCQAFVRDFPDLPASCTNLAPVQRSITVTEAETIAGQLARLLNRDDVLSARVLVTNEVLGSDLDFMAEHAPHSLEECFRLSTGAISCNFTGPSFFMSIVFAQDSSLIDLVSGTPAGTTLRDQAREP